MIRNFQIPGSRFRWFGASLSLFQGILGPVSLGSTLHHLKTLTLYIPQNWDWASEELVTEESLEAVIGFLTNSVPRLATLELSGGFNMWEMSHSPLSRLLGRMVRDLQMSRLKSIKVKDATVSSSTELARFLGRHASSLEAYRSDTVRCEDLHRDEEWSPQKAVDDWAARLRTVGVDARMESEPALPANSPMSW